MPKKVSLDADAVKQVQEESRLIHAEFTIENDCIQSPGKFEGERAHSVYYFVLTGSGSQDWQDGAKVGFKVTPEERHVFPALKGRRTVWFFEDEYGFWNEV